MRMFHLERIEDESKVSGTGRVAEGLEFTDGSCTMRWLTAHRSTTVYSSMADLVHVHGHGGKTKVVYEEPESLKRVPKPHLSLGFEGADAEQESMAHGCGPALPGARAAYDQVKELWAPYGWTAMACWELQGGVYLELKSPMRFLWTEQKESGPLIHFEQYRATFGVTKEKGVVATIDYPTFERRDERMAVFVDGVRGKLTRSQAYHTGSSREAVPPQFGGSQTSPTIPPLSDLHSPEMAPDRVAEPATTSWPCECPVTDFKGGICVKCGGRE